MCPHARPDASMCPHCMGLNDPKANWSVGTITFSPAESFVVAHDILVAERSRIAARLTEIIGARWAAKPTKPNDALVLGEFVPWVQFCPDCDRTREQVEAYGRHGSNCNRAELCDLRDELEWKKP